MTTPDQDWRVVRLEGVHDLDSFYGELSRALDLPDWFGANLDALWEVLMELDRPTRLELPEIERFRRRHPKAWARVSSVLTDRAAVPPEEAVPFSVVS